MRIDPTPDDAQWCSLCQVHQALKRLSTMCPACDEAPYIKHARGGQASAVDAVRRWDGIATRALRETA